MKKQTKYIVFSGGVLSGLGKGISVASIGHLLSQNHKVIPIKCDGYLNSDPGTMNPVEHGEVFILDDGGEVDMDFGHYERFLGVEAKSHWNLTMGKVFKKIVEREREGVYLGKTVQFIPHVTDVIKEWFSRIEEEEEPDIILIEVGGTVGDLENQFYLEAIRQLRREKEKHDLIHVHLTYVPVPQGVQEQKSKPTQMSVRTLNQLGIEPDIIIARCEDYLTEAVKEKIASYANLQSNAIFSGIDVDVIYENPLIYQNQGVIEILEEKLSLKLSPELKRWNQPIKTLCLLEEKEEGPIIVIAICGKYMSLEDSYASIVEALIHCEAQYNVRIGIRWIDTDFEKEQPNSSLEKIFENIDGVIIPGGFGLRGAEGKIKVIQYVREQQIPFLGICYGMQLAVVEFARNVCGIEGAKSLEMGKYDEIVKEPVVTILEDQKSIKLKGGTMRLGGHDISLLEGSLAENLYKSSEIRERFRHRYEVNPSFVKQLESKGMVFSGKAKFENIVQIVELPEHCYFMGCQFHPEITSRLEKPSPVFQGLVETILKKINYNHDPI